MSERRRSEADSAQRTLAGAEGQADGTHRGRRAGRWNSSGAGGSLLHASLLASPGHPSPQPRKPQDRLGRRADGTSLSGAVGQACRAGQPLGSLHAGKRGRAGLVMGDEDGVMGCIGRQGRLGGGRGRCPFLMLTSPQHSPCPMQRPRQVQGQGLQGPAHPLSHSRAGSTGGGALGAPLRSL